MQNTKDLFSELKECISISEAHHNAGNNDMARAVMDEVLDIVADLETALRSKG